MNLATADLWDEYSDQLQCLEPVFSQYGAQKRFFGPVFTLKVFEDNSLVRSTLQQDGGNQVLVIDGGGSLRCALIGDKLASLAINNNWAGIVVFGCIRDSAVIDGMAIGIRALNTTPVKSIKRNEGQSEIALKFAGVSIRPGDWLYADEDGMVLSQKKL